MERIAPRAAEIDQTNCFPRELWPELGEFGLLGITVDVINLMSDTGAAPVDLFSAAAFCQDECPAP